MAKICYNCGKELTKNNKTKEHVPAQCLYEGFDEKYKKNLITVPACDTCNGLYSKIDQELRDVIAIRTNDTSKMNDIVSKGVRSIFKRSNWKDRLKFENNGQAMTVNFSYNDLRNLHIKNFKALFFRKYGVPVPENFKIEIVADGDNDDKEKMKAAQLLFQFMQEGKQFECSGHLDIFKFILKDVSFDESKEAIEVNDLSKADFIVGLLVYHEDLAAIVTAKKDKS